MQIPSLPPPILTNTLQQDVVAKAVPNVQAVPPLLQRAVDPAPRSEKFNRTRSNRDRADGGGSGAEDPGDGKEERSDKRGGAVDFSA